MQDAGLCCEETGLGVSASLSTCSSSMEVILSSRVVGTCRAEEANSQTQKAQSRKTKTTMPTRETPEPIMQQIPIRRTNRPVNQINLLRPRSWVAPIQ